MIWYNRKTKQEEDLSTASVSDVCDKLNITMRRIAEHKEKLEKLHKIKRQLIKLIEKKGAVISTKEELPEVFIYDGALHSIETLEKKGVQVEEAIQNGKLIKM